MIADDKNNDNRKKWLQAFPIDIQTLYEKVDEPLPHSIKRWWWCWGGIVGLLFLVVAGTGLLLAMYYRAEPQTAYGSVTYITGHARYGNFVRSVHQWAANFMIIFLFLHMLRVFVTGAYREYRWGAWMAGVGLLGVTLGMGVTGYSLIYEQISYWAITITSNIMSTVPVVGSTMKQLFIAGEDINMATLSRMYALHVQILPACLILLALLHLFFVRLLGMYIPGNQKDKEEEKTLTASKGHYHFFPDHFTSELSVFLYLVLIICLLALAFPARMGPPSDPMVTPEHIKPEWYFLPFYHMLKVVPGSVGVMLIGVLGLGIFLWPILDHYIFHQIDKLFKGRIEVSVLLGIVAVGIYLALAFVEAGP